MAARASVAAMFDLAAGIDEVMTLAWNGKRGDRAAFRADVQRLRAAGCDTAILLPNSFASAWLVWRARRAAALGLRRRLAVVAADARGAQARRAASTRARTIRRSCAPLACRMDRWRRC